jgi:hypothetical protein
MKKLFWLELITDRHATMHVLTLKSRPKILKPIDYVICIIHEH